MEASLLSSDGIERESCFRHWYGITVDMVNEKLTGVTKYKVTISGSLKADFDKITIELDLVF